VKPPPGWGAPPPPLPPPPPAWPQRPPPPPVDTNPTPASPARPPSRPNWLLIVAIAAGAVFLIAVVASAARSLGREKGHPDYGSVAVRAGVGVAIALAVAVLVVFMVRAAAQQDTALGRTLLPNGPQPTRTLLLHALPWVIVLLALGAVIGAATAPLYRAGTSAIDDSTGESVDPRLPEAEARIVTDEDDNTYVQVDEDGDGTFETLVPCPSSGTNQPPSQFGPEPSPDEPLLVPIDHECDGTIDAYGRLESLSIQAQIPAPPDPSSPSSLPPSRSTLPPSSPTTAPPLDQPGTGPLPDDPTIDAEGSEVDPVLERYDGVYVRTPNGGVRLYLDVDGDGQYETPMSSCPLGGQRGGPATTIPDDGPNLVPIDNNCDGTIDAYARVPDFVPLETLPGVEDEPTPTTRPPATTTAPTSPPTSAPAGADPGDTARIVDRDGGGGALLWIVLGIALVGAVLAIGAFLLIRSRDRQTPPAPTAPPEREPDPAAAAASAAIATSRVQLHGPQDPRDAIIHAYAQLLDGLARSGKPRRDHETPGAYLQRCVDELGVPRLPMERLTDLFSLARFSSHQITEQQRADADACLAQSLADLGRVAVAGDTPESVGAAR
jgi:hypothetical protein